MKLALASSLVALASAGDVSPKNGITASCKPDNTIEVAINHDIKASILSAKYGSCILSDLRGFSDQDVTSWTGSLSPSDCDMDSKLRTLQYNQTAEFTVGRTSGDKKLVFSTYEIDTYCEYTATYTISFEYGTISAEAHDFDGYGGLIGLNFIMESMNSHFNETQSSSTQAGDMIYLQLTLNATANKNFNHAENIAAKSGKAFVPTKCLVKDDTHNFTLFDVSGNQCSNDVVDLAVSYNIAAKAWQIQHVLFLLNDQDSSQYTLTCDLTVCDMQKGDDCKKAYDCLIPPVHGGYSEWSEGDCTVTCGGGAKTQTRRCTNPTPSVNGNSCESEGSATRTVLCNTGPCPIDGSWGAWENVGPCSVSCGDGTINRTRSCDNPEPQNGGNTCPGDASEMIPCSQHICPIHGDWGAWADNGVCDTTCGSGHLKQTRHCNNPAPQYGGRQCDDYPGVALVEDRNVACDDYTACPVDGSWGAWEDVGACSVTCGDGKQSRARRCDNPEPQNGGSTCPGDASDLVDCNDRNCPSGCVEDDGWKSVVEIVNLDCIDYYIAMEAQGGNICASIYYATGFNSNKGEVRPFYADCCPQDYVKLREAMCAV